MAPVRRFSSDWTTDILKPPAAEDLIRLKDFPKLLDMAEEIDGFQIPVKDLDQVRGYGNGGA